MKRCSCSLEAEQSCQPDYRYVLARCIIAPPARRIITSQQVRAAYSAVTMLSKCFCVQDDADSDHGLIMRESSPPNPETITILDNSTFFRDGHRKIDFVLVYEETTRRRASVGPSVLDTSGDRRAKLETWRQRFMTNLRRAGLDMEEVLSSFITGRQSWRKTEI